MAEILLGLGSNLNARKTLQNALTMLEHLVDQLSVSPWYESHALRGGHNYLNFVVKAKTNLSVEQLCTELRTIERMNGRIRDPNAQICALDIDLLCYNRIAQTTAGVELPRRDILEHAHVLLPLSQLCPGDKHPVLDVSYAQLWDEFKDSLLCRQQLWKID